VAAAGHSGLPIDEVLPSIRQHLGHRYELILEAPPGAGKTTVVPIALLDEPWLAGRRILVLEPRRLAARAAAERMSEMLNDTIGRTVGYRMRQDTRVSASTRIEVITEGILTRMLTSDPSLADVGLVIFDEFHERSLDADLGLALTLYARGVFREDDPLRLIVMSATLPAGDLAAMINDAPVVSCTGRAFPVEVIHAPPPNPRRHGPRENIADSTAALTVRALRENPSSSILVFLPGQAEIARCERAISQSDVDNSVTIHPLFGGMSIEAQRAAISPSAPDSRKVVLATNIAETSLTIDGIHVVVDSGQAREPLFDAGTGMTRLTTRRISRASSIQRMGRAGRLAPGRCYRLWAASQQDELAPHITPEIQQTDLTPIVLTLLSWGIGDPSVLAWLNPPGVGPWQQALSLLQSLGAVDTTLAITHHGELMAQLPVHPRLAHMMIAGTELSMGNDACQIAALLSDRDPFGRDDPDLAMRLATLEGKGANAERHRGWARRTRDLAATFSGHLQRAGFKTEHPLNLNRDDRLAFLLASAYPDRIARRRHSGGFQLANGRSAQLAVKHRFARAQWLAVAEVGSVARSRGDTIHTCVALDPALFETLLSPAIEISEAVEFDDRSGKFVAERRRHIGALNLSAEAIPVRADAKVVALANYIRRQGVDSLPWTRELRQWQSRVTLLHQTLGAPWPDVTDDTLIDTLENWLGPWLETVGTRKQLARLDLNAALQTRLPWPLSRDLNRHAPTHLRAPGGSMAAIDYTASPPTLAVKLQEMFSALETPRIAGGRVPLVLHLLSPAGRPLQVTSDLASFWTDGYRDVRREMRGRYPKHPWPEDPLNAKPTGKTKARLARDDDA
jgi:ATP-dependent helicase HrpB